MKHKSEIPEEILGLLKRYAFGQLPPLIDIESPAAGLIDKNWFEVYQIGLRQVLSSSLGVQLASDRPHSLKAKWNNAKNLPLETTMQAWTEFCATLRSDETADEACITCDRYWARRAEEAGCAIAYMCVHGMIDFAVPINANGETIAVAFMGQMFPKPGTAWNPELIEPDGLFRSLTHGEEGVEAWEESLARIYRAEQKYGFSHDELQNLLYLNVEKEATPQDVADRLEKLSSLGRYFSQLVTAKLESERGKVCSWIREGISRSLAQLEAERSTNITAADFKGVADDSVIRVWQQMGEYLVHTCQYFGFAHLVVLLCDYWNGGGTITLLNHYGRSSKDFPFPSRYDCTQWHASLQALYSEMFTWRTATKINLERYASLPVIKSLYDSLRRRRPMLAYAVSGKFVRGVSPALVLGGLDYRKRTDPLSQRELDELTTIGIEIGLVTNICSLVTDLDKATEQQARFIEDVAHDIRNPIQNLISISEYMQIESLPIEVKQQKAKDIVAEVRRIDELSQRVWVLEDLRRGVLDPKRCHQLSTFDTIMRCRKSLEHRAFQNRVTIEVDRELQEWPKVRVNEELFYHTVLNLIDNAVKYSAPNTEVRIGGILRPREYVLTFGNIGIGVPDNEKEHIFELHYRAKNAQMKIREGTGIGLSIVKAFADYYGSVEVESNPLENSGWHLTIFRLIIRRR